MGAREIAQASGHTELAQFLSLCAGDDLDSHQPKVSEPIPVWTRPVAPQGQCFEEGEGWTTGASSEHSSRYLEQETVIAPTKPVDEVLPDT